MEKMPTYTPLSKADDCLRNTDLIDQLLKDKIALSATVENTDLVTKIMKQQTDQDILIVRDYGVKQANEKFLNWSSTDNRGPDDELVISSEI